MKHCFLLLFTASLVLSAQVKTARSVQLTDAPKVDIRKMSVIERQLVRAQYRVERLKEEKTRLEKAAARLKTIDSEIAAAVAEVQAKKKVVSATPERK